MPKEEHRTISIVTISEEKPGDEHSMFPSPRRLVAKTQEVSVQEMTRNLGETVTLLQAVVDSIPERPGTFTVDSFTFALAVNAGGKISLIAELSGQISSTITVTLKRQGKIRGRGTD